MYNNIAATGNMNYYVQLDAHLPLLCEPRDCGAAAVYGSGLWCSLTGRNAVVFPGIMGCVICGSMLAVSMGCGYLSYAGTGQ